MQTEIRKINLIEELLKISNEDTLSELENVLKKSKGIKKTKPFSAKEFSGIWTKKDAALIAEAIENSCEQIHEDKWK